MKTTETAELNLFPKTKTAKLITFGNGGHGKEYGRHHRLSGYERPDTYTVDPAEDEGAIVLDKIPALETDEGFSWVFRGPMVNVDLAPGERDCLSEVSPVFAQAMAEGANSFSTLLAIHAATSSEDQPGALDHVSLVEYVAGWKQRGARVGEVINGAIVWMED